MHVALPALRAGGEKQAFMDLHVTSDSGAHDIVEMSLEDMSCLTDRVPLQVGLLKRDLFCTFEPTFKIQGSTNKIFSLFSSK